MLANNQNALNQMVVRMGKLVSKVPVFFVKKMPIAQATWSVAEVDAKRAAVMTRVVVLKKYAKKVNVY